MSRTAPLVVAVLIVSLGALTGKSAGGSYHQAREIHADLEDFSHTAIDSTSGRLLIGSRRGVFAYSMTRKRLEGLFSDAQGARLAIAPDLGRVLVASLGTVTLLNLADGHAIASTAISGRPSAVLYDRGQHEFFVDRVSEVRRDIFVFDRDGKQVRRLSGFEDRGMSALAPRGRLLIAGGDHISVVETGSGETTTWPLNRGDRSSWLAVDSAGDRVFVSLEGHIVMLDGTTGARLASIPTSGSFVLGYDGVARRLVYGWNAGAIGEEAYITAAEVQGDRLVPVQQIRIPRGPGDLQINDLTGGFTLSVDPDPGTFRRLVFEFK